MTYYVLIAFCIIILIAYLFDITSRYSKIPGVLLLIITGIFIQSATAFFDFTIPDMSRMLPIMGTLGLILIVLEGSLDLTIRRDKLSLIIGSISSAIVPFVLFIGIFSYILANFLDYNLKMAVINIIPLAIISSAVAIPSASNLDPANREFIVYESSISDIIGILLFDFILLSSGSLGFGIARFAAEFIMTILASIVLSTGLALMLHKINLHVKYVIIMTVIILVYALAKLIHLPSLLVVFIFGLVMNNNQLFRNKYFIRMIDFEEFNVELDSFKNIVAELTFVVRSFFFILFGFYTSLSDLLSLGNLLCSLAISISIFLLRALFFITVLRTPITPLVFFAPRGLITILLFFSIPSAMLLPFMNVGVVTQTIFITILVMTLGNMLYQKKALSTGSEAKDIR
ncbi:MAG: cation:proton antiporter [Syntrophorhabdales bacterium]|nr:cation:proton antiporter [Syntrophorhabdales bacterium]